MAVAIQEVSKQEFDDLNTFEHCAPLWPREEEWAWFVDSANTLVGVLLFHAETQLWGHSICRRADGGQYQRIAVATDIPSADMARLDLVASMRRLA
jgi:hypothetical protein